MEYAYYNLSYWQFYMLPSFILNLFNYMAMIITICGSTRFKEDIEQVRKQLTLSGHIVLGPEIYGHSGDIITDNQKRNLDILHKEKIHMSDSIYVVNKDGYIGESTRSEIEWAKWLGKQIIYMEENHDNETL